MRDSLHGQVIAVEQNDRLRAFVALDELERLTAEDDAAGKRAGAKEQVINGAENTRLDYRVVARDKQGNQKLSLSRRVYIPFDDDNLGSQGVFSDTIGSAGGVADFGGSYSTMTSGMFTYSWTPNTADNCLFELIGPNNGTWDVTVAPNVGSPTELDNTMFPAGPRQTLYSNEDCNATQYVVTVNSGTFGLDAVLGSPTSDSWVRPRPPAGGRGRTPDRSGG